jgi:hypothetical protein
MWKTEKNSFPSIWLPSYFEGKPLIVKELQKEMDLICVNLRNPPASPCSHGGRGLRIWLAIKLFSLLAYRLISLPAYQLFLP